MAGKESPEIPTFTCKPGCTDCCGPVPFSPAEWQAVALDAAQRKIQARQGKDGFMYPEPDEKLNCRFIENGACSIYDRRPLVCRLFGNVDDHRMCCPHGCGPEKKLTFPEGAGMMHRYIRNRG